MKMLLTTTIFIGGSLAFAQTPPPKNVNLGYDPGFQQRNLLEDSKIPTKKNTFDLAAPSKGKKPQIRQKLTDIMKASQGSEGVGGGNGVQSSDGKITPLDVVFAQENKVIDVKKEYSIGYKYFRQQVDKISKAIPSFANDIETKFASLTWIASGLDLSASKGCLNNMGIFQVRVGDKQVVLACQNSEGEVSLNKRAIKQLKDPRYLGVVLLHEAFVNSMLHEYRSDEYPQAEFQMISRIVPYIISNQTLNPEKLYEYAQVVRYVRDQNHFNKYALEAFEDRRISYEKDQDEKNTLADWKSNLEPAIEKLFQLRKALGCDGSNVESYIVTYGRLVEAYRQVIDANTAFSKSSANSNNAAEVAAMNEVVSNELAQIQNDHESTMNSLLKNCQK